MEEISKGSCTRFLRRKSAIWFLALVADLYSKKKLPVAKLQDGMGRNCENRKRLFWHRLGRSRGRCRRRLPCGHHVTSTFPDENCAQLKLTPTVHCFRINPVKISLGIISAAGELYCDTWKTSFKSSVEVSVKDLMIQLQFPRAIKWHSKNPSRLSVRNLLTEPRLRTGALTSRRVGVGSRSLTMSWL